MSSVTSSTGALYFTDKTGRNWDLGITLGIAREIDAGDFSEYYKPKWSFIKPEKDVFSAMIGDQQFMWAVIWALVQRQAREKFINGEFVWGEYEDMSPDERRTKIAEAFKTDENGLNFAELEFVDSLNGKALSDGRAAFWRSLADFFPEQETVLSVLGRQYDRLRVKVNESVKEMEQDMEVNLDNALAADRETIKEKMRNLITERSSN